MKKILLFILPIMLLAITVPAQAQLVDIPDANFRAKLKTLYPACFIGDKMESTCNKITAATFLDVQNSNITDLSGLEYFTSLTYLRCTSNQIISLPALPSSLSNLNCGSNKIATLASLTSPINILVL